MTVMINAIVQVLLGAASLWGEPPLTVVQAGSVPPPEHAAAMRLYAARGEHESFQLCLRPGGADWTNVVVAGESLGPGIGPPRIQRVGYVSVADESGAVRSIPDPLFDAAPADLAAGETAVYWITYAVHGDCAPGAYSGRVTVRADGEPKRDFPVTIDVFDFQIPGTPTVAAAFRLDTGRIAERYGLRYDEPLSWKPVYDAVSDFRIAFGIHDQDMPDEAFREHLAYAVSRNRSSVIDLTPRPSGLGRFPAPDIPTAQDPLQTYFLEMSRWLSEKGWQDRAYFQPATEFSADGWQGIRAAYFRARRADKRIALVMEGAIHPYFERYVDIWAPGLDVYQPNAHRALAEGLSLAVRQGAEAAAVAASSTGVQPGGIATRAEDAYDGSAFSEWWSGGGLAEESLRISLVEPVVTRSVRIGWVPGREASDIVVRTSFDGRVFSRAKVSWSHRPGVHVYDRSISDGAFVTDKRLLAVEFLFKRPRSAGPIAVAEIELAPPLGEAVDRPSPARVWMRQPSEGFPDLRAGGPRIAPRLFAWIAWGHRADGLAGGSLNPWPEAWNDGAEHFELGAPYSGWTYPGGEGIAPSIRMHLLRDGLEDYEYCRLADALVAGGARPPDTVAGAIAPRYFTAAPDPEIVTRYTAEIPVRRIALGRFIADPSAPVTNFQGGRP